MVFWSGPRTGPCLTCFPVSIRTPEPYRRAFWLSPCGLPGRQPGSLNRMFSLWGWFCFEKVYPQTRRAYYLFSYYLFFNYMSVRVFQRKNGPEVRVFQRKIWFISEGVSARKTTQDHRYLWINPPQEAPGVAFSGLKRTLESLGAVSSPF